MFNKISEMEETLAELYPDKVYGSYAELFQEGLMDGLISQEEYQRARVYYAYLWYYGGS
jgi:hypothetical protein